MSKINAPRRRDRRPARRGKIFVLLALMLLLFAGGVMNVWTIAVLTAFVLFEKLAPFAGRTRQLSAAGLLAAAMWMIMR